MLAQQEQQYVSSETVKPEKYVGAPLRRREDQRFLTGKAQYITDIKFPQILYVVFVRSPYAHARIRQIDTAKARQTPGVIAVLTAADFLPWVGEVPCAVRLPFANYPKHYPIASEEVNYQGEIVAVVLAEDEYIAKDAEELVVVEYEILPAVLDAEKAISSESDAFVHKELQDNTAYNIKQTFLVEGQDDSSSEEEKGRRIKAILSSSDHVSSFRLYNQRIFSSAIETRCVIAKYDASTDEITMLSSTQYPHLVRTFVSKAINYPESKLRVIAPDIGGGFGGKSNVYAEEILVPFMAWKLLGGKRPIKWIETRSESMVATAHGRDIVQYVDVGTDKAGRIKALRVRLIADIGAYHHLLTPAFPLISAFDIPGNYRIPAYEIDVTAVFTNKKSTDAYRGVAASEACFCVERTMDIIAEQLGLDPADVRLHNYVTPEEYPYTNVMGEPNAPGNLPLSMNMALEAINYDEFRREQKRFRESQRRYLGIGFSTYWELGGFGPPTMTEQLGLEHGGFESASVRILPTGNVVVTSGSSSHGQGHETAFAQIAADSLQVSVEDVTVNHGDTLNAPYGIGTFASRSAAVGGTAIFLACEKILEKARTIAASLLHRKPDEILFEHGTFFPSKGSGEEVTLQRIVQEAYLARKLPPGTEPGMEAFCYFNPQEPTFASGTHACIVEMDVETGKANVLKYVAINDFGTIVNPLIVEGQVHGGVVQGMGQALLEEIAYGEEGQLLTTNFLDYLIPTSTDPTASNLFDIEIGTYKTETSANPLGVKGMGESGTIAAPAAVVNAVKDAVKPFGARLLRMPVKPELVWKEMRNCQ